MGGRWICWSICWRDGADGCATLSLIIGDTSYEKINIFCCSGSFNFGFMGLFKFACPTAVIAGMGKNTSFGYCQFLV